MELVPAVLIFRGEHRQSDPERVRMALGHPHRLRLLQVQPLPEAQGGEKTEP